MGMISVVQLNASTDWRAFSSRAEAEAHLRQALRSIDRSDRQTTKDIVKGRMVRAFEAVWGEFLFEGR